MPYILIACIVFGFGTGFYASHEISRAGHVVDLENQLKKQKEYIDSAHAADIAFINAHKQQEVIAEVITKEVIKYVTKIQKVDSDCNLSNGTKRLLDDSRMQNYPRESVAADTGASSIREIDLIRYTNKITQQYNSMRLQCNSLINLEKIQE